MDQRYRVQRLITQSGYNPRRATSRRARVVPVNPQNIEQIMTTVQPIIVEERSPSTESIADIVDNLEQLVIEDTITELSDDSDISEALEERRANIRQDIATVRTEDLRSFYRKFFRGITNMNAGQLLFIYSIYLQLDDDDLRIFTADMRDLFENPDLDTLSLYSESIVLIPPTIRMMDGISTLIINGTNIEELPVEIAEMPDIQTVLLTNNTRLTRIPNSVQPLVIYQD